MSFGLAEMANLDERGWLAKLERTASQLPKAPSSVVIAVVPCFLSSDDVLTAVCSCNNLWVRSVIAKVNVNSFYGPHHEVLGSAGLLLPGYAQAILLDSFGNYESDVDNL